VKTLKTNPLSPCSTCWKRDKFSFKECGNYCLKLRNHLDREVFSKNVSPCRDLICGIPGADKKRIGCPEKCPLPEIYSINLGNGAQSRLGKYIRPNTEYGHDLWKKKY
jgi:hypothetical protein